MTVSDGITVLVFVFSLLVLTHTLPRYLASKIIREVVDDSLLLVDEETALKKKSLVLENQKDKAWRRLRTEGWISNGIVFMVIIGFFQFFSDELLPMMKPFETDVLLKVPVIYVADSFRSLISLCLQFILNCKYFKMSSEDLSLIRRQRDTWTEGLESAMLIDRYGYVPVKIMDAINRRVGHLIHYAIHVSVFAFSVKTPSSALQTFFYLAIFRIFMHIVLENNNYLGVVDYSGARIRDGRFGRFNLLVVSFWGGFSKVVLVMVLIISGFSGTTDYKKFLPMVIIPLQGVMWGDTAGEMVGSFFGKLEFNVSGFGETNRKTVEGTVAVWLATAISSWSVLIFMNTAAMQFQGSEVALVCFLSTVVTIMETAAPRGTDNFFIILGSIACLLFFV